MLPIKKPPFTASWKYLYKLWVEDKTGENKEEDRALDNESVRETIKERNEDSQIELQIQGSCKNRTQVGKPK